MRFISDLACELLRRRPADLPGVTITTHRQHRVITQTTVITDPAAAQTIGKPLGTYLNLDASAATDDQTSTALTNGLRPLLTTPGKLLVVGLGNDNIVADSLGPQVLQRLQTGANLVTFAPSVFGVTGINSVDAIQAITNLVKPATVIIIDSLVSAAPERIGTNYQICTSGITPGSGIGRNNQRLDQDLLGVPVLAIGIPVCTIMTRPKQQIYHVVPKDIDLVINDCATNIANALNNWA